MPADGTPSPTFTLADAAEILSPYDIAGNSARRVSATYEARPHGEAWAVFQSVTWKNLEGDWDGETHRLLSGLTEAEARAFAEQRRAA